MTADDLLTSVAHSPVRRARRAFAPDGLLVVFTLLCTSCGACKPKATLSVSPHGYCESTKRIHIEWKAKHGEATLMVTPPDSAPKPVSSSGKRDIEPPHDTTIQFTVDNGKIQDQRIVQVRAAKDHSLDGAASACVSVDWIKTDPFEFGSATPFDPSARLSVISNRCASGADDHATCRRKVQVVHAGHTWSLEPDGVLDASPDDAPLSGPWELRAQLLPGEACGTPSAATARNIELSIQIDCP